MSADDLAGAVSILEVSSVVSLIVKGLFITVMVILLSKNTHRYKAGGLTCAVTAHQFKETQNKPLARKHSGTDKYLVCRTAREGERYID